jgi:hypothetical protein
MDMHPRFFAREEIEPIIAIPENCRTHTTTLFDFSRDFKGVLGRQEVLAVVRVRG